MTEPDKKKILAKIFCLKEDTVDDDDTRFNEFWVKVEDCEILDNDKEKFTEAKFDESLEKLQEKFKKGNYDCLVLAVSSHGEEKYNENDVGSFEIIWKHRGRKQNYQINKLFKLFDETDDLKDKKKIFLLQMCRNRNDKSTVTRDGTDTGVSHSQTDPDLHQLSDPIPNTIHESASEGSFLKERIVVWPKTWKIAQLCIKNSIAFFSSPSGFRSYTTMYDSLYSGGWLFVCMRNLVDGMRKSVDGIKKQKISVMDLFLMVNKEMSEMQTIRDGHVVVSSFNHMLTEDIFINIKLH